MIESVNEERYWLMDGGQTYCHIALDKEFLEDPEYVGAQIGYAFQAMAAQAKQKGRKLRPLTVSIEYDTAYLTHVLRVREA